MRREPFHRSKFLLGIVSILLIMAAWRWAVFHLYTLPPETISAFQAITTQALWGVVAIALTLAGVKGVERMMTAKFESVATAATQAIQERREEKIERIEHVYEEGAEGAPQRRPFAPQDHAAE